MPSLRLSHLLLWGLCYCVAPCLNAANYYWVGGDGNWSDVTHWATTSGGGITHVQTPTADDDVFFDANSFPGGVNVVVLDGTLHFCRNMDWTGAGGAPALVGGDQAELNVFGSLTLLPAVDWRFTGRLNFVGAADNTVTLAGEPAASAVTFDGAGSWTLTTPLEVTGRLTLTEGRLETGSQALTVGRLRSVGDRARTFAAGASLVVFTADDFNPANVLDPLTDDPVLELDGNNLFFDAAGATLRFRGQRADVEIGGELAMGSSLGRVEYTSPTGYSDLRADAANNANLYLLEELTLAHDARLDANFSLDTLRLTPGQNYVFGSDRTITLGGLEATGDCSAPISLTSPDADRPGGLSVTSFNGITTDFTVLQNMTITFGTATANNVIDLGGNLGWALNERPVNDLYWVGGNGNWSDPNNWSETSGGPSSGCIPSLADNVFFDIQSFTFFGQEVTVDVAQADCRDMSWFGALFFPRLNGPAEHRLRVNGSLRFNPIMIHDFAGDYRFVGSDQHTIRTFGRPFRRDVTFAGRGSWRLIDELYVEDVLYLTAGTLITDGEDVEVNQIRSLGTGERGLELGSSTVTITSHSAQYGTALINLRTDNLSVDPGNSVINFESASNGSFNAEGDDSLRLHTVNFLTPNNQFIADLDLSNDGGGATIDTLRFFNSGEMRGDNVVAYGQFAAGRSYTFQVSNTQTFGQLIIDGSCEDGQTALFSTRTEARATLDLPNGVVYDQLLLRDVELADGKTATANSSIDLGGNTGWTITNVGNRTLYWVGGDGDWFDRAHWSLSAGGPGGECIPTLDDDVIYTAAGNPAGGFTVTDTTDRFAACRNLDFRADLGGAVVFGPGSLRMAGSFTNNATLDFRTDEVNFYRNGDNTVLLNGANFEIFNFLHYGSYTFLDDFRGNIVQHYTGNLRFANDRGQLERLVFRQSASQKAADFGSIRIALRMSGRPAFEIDPNARLTLDPGTSAVALTAPGATARINMGTNLNELTFTAPTGTAVLDNDDQGGSDVAINYLSFASDAAMESYNIVTDTLLFAPGKTYTLLAGATQTINNYWRTIGTNCTPISLRSSSPGSQAITRVPAGAEILADFIQMRNMTAEGGAAFNAGARSTDINNSNVGWTFETAPRFETIGFLGEDRTLCGGAGIVLDAFNFSPGETYLWSDGSTDTTLVTTAPGEYSVEVTFGSNCVTRDTVIVLDPDAFEVNLPPDTTLCAGESLRLSVPVPINSAEISWQDGSTEPSLLVTQAGMYKVSIDLDGCVKSDSLMVTYNDPPTVDITEDRITPCLGEAFAVTATGAAADFTWSDGTTGLDLTGTVGGTYRLTASIGNCVATDSVLVEYIDPGTVDLGVDTVLCGVSALTLDAGRPGFTYRWQDGSTAPTLTATTTGRYAVTIDTANCTATDTIALTFPERPILSLAPAYERCDGETLALTAEATALNPRWSNGQTGPDFTTTSAGDYFLAYDYDACADTLRFTAAFPAPPALELGPDTALCAGETLLLDAGRTGTWQDGSQATTFPVSAAGGYAVTVTDGPCTVADTRNVSFISPPAVNLGADRIACQGDELRVTVATDPANLVFWDDGDNQRQRNFIAGGVRAVEVEDVNGCVSVDSVRLEFREPPVLDLGPDTTHCADRPLLLTATAGPGRVIWQDGSTGDQFRVTGGGLVLAVLSDEYCTVLDSVRVTLEDCVDFRAYLPTAFSPNLDGINDDFGGQFSNRVEIREYRLEVYDRWGARVYETDDRNQPWNGELRDGQPAQMGVYVYVLRVGYTDDRGRGERTLSGDVMLLR